MLLIMLTVMDNPLLKKKLLLMIFTMERGSSVVEFLARKQVSPGSNPALLLCRRLGIFVLSIDAPVDSAV